MMEYGLRPDPDIVEITLFGPGYGEAIAVHLGENAWLLIDSCLDPDAKGPASLSYLDAIGVAPANVRAVIASHWHDDHARGISSISEACPQAEFFISGALNTDEASTFLSAYSGQSSSGLARGARELFSVISQREFVIPALHRNIIFQGALNGQLVLVTALSPLPAAFAQSIAKFAQYLPTEEDPITYAPDLHPNVEAVAVHIDLGVDAVLLGADLEEHQQFGWSALVQIPWSQGRRLATAYKVAHHGSHTGDCNGIWSTFLSADPVSCLTPFTLGRHRLPTDADRARINGKTSSAFITSRASRRPMMDRHQEKRLSDICKNLHRVDAGFGAVRLRKRIGGEKPWKTELFGSAGPI